MIYGISSSVALYLGPFVHLVCLALAQIHQQMCTCDWLSFVKGFGDRFFSILCTAQHLESESRDKQLQLERRRKASLFISMLKNTNPGDETEANKYDDC